MSFWKFSAKPRIPSECSPTCGNVSRYEKWKSILKCQKWFEMPLSCSASVTIHWLMNNTGNLLFATQQVYKGFPDLFCVIYILYERGSGVWRVDNPQGIDHLDWPLIGRDRSRDWYSGLWLVVNAGNRSPGLQARQVWKSGHCGHGQRRGRGGGLLQHHLPHRRQGEVTQ